MFIAPFIFSDFCRVKIRGLKRGIYVVCRIMVIVVIILI
jgi:hypothetical protein